MRQTGGGCRSGMTEGTNSRLAALRGLEESLRCHRRAQAAEASAAGADEPSRLKRRTARAPARRMTVPQLRWRVPTFSLPGVPRFLRSRAVRRFAIVLAGIFVIAAAGCGALWYRLSSGPITLDFATGWLAAAIKE